MLESLVVHNFQAHSKEVIYFSPTITSIVGSSDVGKTSLIRALRWLSLNHPSGDDFITHGETSTKVKLVLDNFTITRKRSEKDNSYELTREEVKVFRSFGSGKVPDEIEDLLLIGEINFQDQHAPPFWFFETPGKVARELNSIVDLSIIDESTLRASQEVRKAKTTLEVCEDRLKEARLRKQELSWVPAFCLGTKDLEERHRGLQETISREERLRTLLQEAKCLKERLEGSVETLERGESLIEKWSSSLEETKKLEDLMRLVHSVKVTQTEIENSKRQAKEIEKQIKEESQGVCPVCGGELEKD